MRPTAWSADIGSRLTSSLPKAFGDASVQLRRREILALITMLPGLDPQVQKKPDQGEPRDWTCPMDPDVHLDGPGVCPRCGMKLVLAVPDRVEYPLQVTIQPPLVSPGEEAVLSLRVADPKGQPVRRFEIVHEKLIHLFIVTEDLTFFAHLHPVPQNDGSFRLPIKLPNPGMYRVLADYYPYDSIPQLAVETL